MVFGFLTMVLVIFATVLGFVAVVLAIKLSLSESLSLETSYNEHY